MLGKVTTPLLTEEQKADASVVAIEAVLDAELTEDTIDLIDRNVRHLEIVLPNLSVSKQKLDEINLLIATAKALVE